ncbi:MAG: hypothetical protein WAN65_27615, partial [Candidatus Sulfotelmatobacter sp.]
ICAVANAYKHDKLHDPKHPIRSDDDVLVVGAGYGIDGFGLGKFGGIEVIVHQTNGEQRKFLAWISEGANKSWCSPAGARPARVRP